MVVREQLSKVAFHPHFVKVVAAALPRPQHHGDQHADDHHGDHHDDDHHDVVAAAKPRLQPMIFV